MYYWIAFKNGVYVSGTDEFGYPLHTTNRQQAHKFHTFDAASVYLSLGYAILKEY